ncbi:MAG: hypothetical protein ABIP81_01595, partial [Terriglobales bacterium]
MKYPSLVILLVMLAALVGCRKDEAPAKSTQTAEMKAPAQAPAPVNPAFTGSVTGVVNLAGASPKAAAIDMSQDPACVMGPNAGGAHVSEAFAVKSGKLGNVFVYVKEGLAAGNYGVPTAPVVIDQQGCKYVPHVAGAVAGQTVR